jgi:hypothetical protein
MTDIEDPERQARAAEFRAFLADIDGSVHGFARTLLRLGDTRAKATVMRAVERLASGEHTPSGEMRVIMSIFRHSRKKRDRAGQQAAPAQQTQPHAPH